MSEESRPPKEERKISASEPHVRDECPEDAVAVRTLCLEAFEGPGEAHLVELLRQRADPIVSLVAEAGEEVVGHILFTPCTLSDHRQLRILGLAPMAVRSARQRQGIGGRLVRAGIERCRSLADGLVVLGHPDYYPRFGFLPAEEFGLGCEYDVPAGVFQAMELREGAFRGVSGTVRYHPAFAELPE